jgi:hypothetical protein
MSNDWMTLNNDMRKCGRRWSWPNLIHYLIFHGRSDESHTEPGCSWSPPIPHKSGDSGGYLTAYQLHKRNCFSELDLGRSVP